MTVKKTDAVRILSTVLLAGEKYQPNELVAGIPENERASLAESGMISEREADVKYCAETLKAPILHYGKPRQVAEPADADE